MIKTQVNELSLDIPKIKVQECYSFTPISLYGVNINSDG
jgi:hypothetical protein